VLHAGTAGEADPTWAAFLESPETLAPTAGTREAWSRGRSTYVVWALRLRSAALDARVAAVRERLAFADLDAAPATHVTVWVAGFPRRAGRVAAARPPERTGEAPPTREAASDTLDDDVDPAVLQAQRAVLRARPRLRLQVGAASSFLSCVTLAVHDPDGALADLRADLDAIAGRHGAREIRFAPYTPHVTCGVYTRALPTRRVAEALAPLRDLPALDLHARLACLSFDARIPGAPLRPWRPR
jgi:hypothetical protein